LEISILTKLLPPALAGVDSGLENAVSAILICRFLLELRNVTENLGAGGMARTVSSISFGENPGIRGHISRINENIVGEFGVSRNASTLEGFSGRDTCTTYS